MIPFWRRGYSGIYQGLNYTVRASFNNQLEFRSRHIAVPAVPTAQDSPLPAACMCLTDITKSIFIAVTWGIQKREVDSPYIREGFGAFLA